MNTERIEAEGVDFAENSTVFKGSQESFEIVKIQPLAARMKL